MGVVYKARAFPTRSPGCSQDGALRRPCLARGARAVLHRIAGRRAAPASRGSSRFTRSASMTGSPISHSSSWPAGSLANKIGGKPQPTREAAEIVHDLALAMREAHRQQHHPPRPEAGQRASDPGRTAQDHRLWPGEATGRRLGTDPHRRNHGVAKLHGARAGLGPDPPDRPLDRPVRSGRDPLRDARRPPAVPGCLGP